jgi:hypothetical protein
MRDSIVHADRKESSIMSIYHVVAPVLAATLFLGGCAATGGKSAAEASPGKYVNYSCENGKRFSARFDPETGSARIRTLEGSTELARGARGLFKDAGDEWLLTLSDGKRSELVHKGKLAYANCAAE